MRNKILLFLLAFIGISQIAAASAVRDKYNFNSEWLLYVGDIPEAKEVRFQDTDWKKVTLPRPFNEDEAFRLSIEQLTDTIMWYRKHFRLPANSKNKKFLLNLKASVKELIFISMVNISACMKWCDGCRFRFDSLY